MRIGTHLDQTQAMKECNQKFDLCMQFIALLNALVHVWMHARVIACLSSPFRPGNGIIRLPHLWSGDSQGQEMFLTSYIIYIIYIYMIMKYWGSIILVSIYIYFIIHLIVKEAK